VRAHNFVCPARAPSCSRTSRCQSQLDCMSSSTNEATHPRCSAPRVARMGRVEPHTWRASRGAHSEARGYYVVGGYYAVGGPELRSGMRGVTADVTKRPGHNCGCHRLHRLWYMRGDDRNGQIQTDDPVRHMGLVLVASIVEGLGSFRTHASTHASHRGGLFAAPYVSYATAKYHRAPESAMRRFNKRAS
jgi:hypothetical protein